MGDPSFAKDGNLGELMSTVCSVHVEGGWAGVGACSAEGVDGPAGSAGGRLGVDLFCSVSHAAKASKTTHWSILLNYSRCRRRFCPLMPAGPDFR